MTLNLEAGAFAAAGAFFVLRSLPLLKGVLGLLGTNGTGRESVTDVYLKQIAENTLQMEWCLDCHRNPAKYLRPTSEIYNIAWETPSSDRPVWCAAGDEKSGVPTAESVNCVTKEPTENEDEMSPSMGQIGIRFPKYVKFTSQDQLGHFLVDYYKIRTPNELASCEVCHR